MKSFKKYIAEVAEPLSPDEKRFKDQHSIEVIDMAPPGAEVIFKGYHGKDTSKAASYHGGEDEAVYDQAYSGEGQSRVDWINQWYVNQLDGYAKRGMYEEIEIQKRHIEKHKAAGKKVYHRVLHNGRDAGGKTDNHEEAKKIASQYRGKMKKQGYNHSGVKVHHYIEETELSEAIKEGSLKLKDGSTVTLTKEDISLLNWFSSQTSDKNMKKATDQMMKNKKGFDFIMDFIKTSKE